MNPEVPSSTPAEVTPTPPEAGGEAPAPVLPEAPVVPEAAGDTTPPPVAEEAQAADRMIGPPPGMTEEDLARNYQKRQEEAQAAANAGNMVNRLSPSTVNTPLQPPAPLPSFHTAEEAAASAPAEAAPEAPAPADTAPVTEPSTPESQA